MIKKFVRLRSKNYAFSYVKEYEQFLKDEDKLKLVRCKGTTGTTICNDINLKSLENTLKESARAKNDNYCIRSKKHQLGLYKINKVSLSCYDDKRHILEDRITSYAHGHYNVEKCIK